MIRRLLLAATLAALALPTAAEAYSLDGRAWPDRTLNYFNAARASGKAVQQAVRAWNGSGVRVRFRRSSLARADVVIRPTDGRCFGYATVGYYGRGRPARVVIAREGCGPFTRFIVAHELGHVLGLGHEDRRCALMNTTLFAKCEGELSPLQRGACRAFERDDIRGAIRLYGGTIRRLAIKGCT